MFRGGAALLIILLGFLILYWIKNKYQQPVSDDSVTNKLTAATAGKLIVPDPNAPAWTYEHCLANFDNLYKIAGLCSCVGLKRNVE